MPFSMVVLKSESYYDTINEKNEVFRVALRMQKEPRCE